MKQRVHNEWFMPIQKTTCPCRCKKVAVFAWGEYVNGKWRTVDYFCQTCFQVRVIPQLTSHAAGCGCTFALNARSGYRIPEWIQMPTTCHKEPEKARIKEVA